MRSAQLEVANASLETALNDLVVGIGNAVTEVVKTVVRIAYAPIRLPATIWAFFYRSSTICTADSCSRDPLWQLADLVTRVNAWLDGPAAPPTAQAVSAAQIRSHPVQAIPPSTRQRPSATAASQLPVTARHGAQRTAAAAPHQDPAMASADQRDGQGHGARSTSLKR